MLLYFPTFPFASNILNGSASAVSQFKEEMQSESGRTGYERTRPIPRAVYGVSRLLSRATNRTQRTQRVGLYNSVRVKRY